MFNKNLIQNKATIVRAFNDFSNTMKYRKNIKCRITHAMSRDQKCAMWCKTTPEAFDAFEICVAEYLENHKDWVKSKGFTIEDSADCVIISW